jgi:hypothetical protein
MYIIKSVKLYKISTLININYKTLMKSVFLITIFFLFYKEMMLQKFYVGTYASQRSCV